MSGYRPDNGFEGLMAHVRSELKEDKLVPAPQNMNTVEEPEVDPEEIGVEDYSEEDLNSTPAKPAPKSKSKDDDRYKIREVPDKEVENPAPKKEAKTGKGDLYLCENCYKTFRSHEAICPHCRSNIVERVVVEDKNPVPKKKLPRFKRPSEEERMAQRMRNFKAITGQDPPGKKDEAVTEGEDRAEEIANAIARALQPLDYWHTQTMDTTDGVEEEFITTGGPKVRVIIETGESTEPE